VRFVRACFRFLFAFAGSWALTVCASQARVDQGNVFAAGPDRREVQITSSGADSQPDLARDGTKVVFVRARAAGTSEVWIADATPRGTANSLIVAPVRINGRRFDQVFTPRFSPDGRVVYFLIAYGGSTQALIRALVADPQPEFVAAVLNFQVVPDGPYQGDIVAQVHKAKLAPGYYDWYWLLTPGWPGAP
jgi:hypothetical protein